jgi:hypothetical protein
MKQQHSTCIHRLETEQLLCGLKLLYPGLCQGSDQQRLAIERALIQRGAIKVMGSIWVEFLDHKKSFLHAIYPLDSTGAEK